MEFATIEAKLSKKITTVVKRLEINDIIGISTVYDGISDAKIQADKFLLESYYNKIRVENVIVLSDVKNKKALTQNNENKRMQNEIENVLKFLLNEIQSIAEKGDFKYELNSLFKKVIEFIDLKMEKMNYKTWLEKKAPKITETYAYVLLNDERFAYPFDKIDLSEYCISLINSSFNYRRQLLQHLKNVIINIFSKYLFLPDLKTLPKFSFSCNQTDICELILALQLSGSFNEYELLKAHFLKIFDITNKQYNDAVAGIPKREKTKGQFLTKLLENINKMPKPKPKSKKDVNPK